MNSPGATRHQRALRLASADFPAADLATPTRSSRFEVRKPIEVRGGIVAPWMDSGGGGVQFLLPSSIEELLEGGFLGRIG
jgi:hypothetical protein